ncbi:P-loop containing nucleoside triphosphate hydrolase protein [Mycena metata]|uniref:P-loop containing nucleoside triphosphate hydrolase protein n=1 Tax=Mycena metata TaxID=1033252 RepID=A0AAD7HM28_9AGAR|nr:P-loop containing nucleoside triphosphate hydrolase protein [Mycena metata]
MFALPLYNSLHAEIHLHPVVSLATVGLEPRLTTFMLPHTVSDISCKLRTPAAALESQGKGGAGDNVLRYATVTASTLQDITQSAPVPFLRTIAAVSLSILTIAESIKSNKEQCMRMVSEIDELLSAILHLYVKSDSAEDALSPATLHNIGEFVDTLQKIHSFIEAQQNNSKFRRFFRQSDNTAQLGVCTAGLRHALDVFGVRSSIVATTELAAIREQAERRHEDLVQLFTEKVEVTESDTVSEASTASIGLLPASPKIFHGRSDELKQLVHLLVQDPARVAIFGPGGIGKTSLALAAVHHPDISTRYTDRHFVSCESVANGDGLLSMIASSVGLEPSRNASKQLLRHFSQSPPALLVLDNLETCWEPFESRNHVEEILSLLTDITHFALLITMRGAERPSKVRWTRPFISPLEPLSDDAAMQTFVDVADCLDDDKHIIREILGLTDQAPLAINLVANLAAFEGHETVLLRWREEKTALFSDGRDKCSNLEFSIQLSLSSPRMAGSPGAHQLLSLLSLLPDGILETELFQCNLEIPVTCLAARRLGVSRQLTPSLSLGNPSRAAASKRVPTVDFARFKSTMLSRTIWVRGGRHQRGTSQFIHGFLNEKFNEVYVAVQLAFKRSNTVEEIQRETADVGMRYEASEIHALRDFWGSGPYGVRERR